MLQLGDLGTLAALSAETLAPTATKTNFLPSFKLLLTRPLLVRPPPLINGDSRFRPTVLIPLPCFMGFSIYHFICDAVSLTRL